MYTADVFPILEEKICQLLSNTDNVQRLHLIELGNPSETILNDMLSSRGNVFQPPVNVSRSSNAMCLFNRELDRTMSSANIRDPSIQEEIRNLSQRLKDIERNYSTQQD